MGLFSKKSKGSQDTTFNNLEKNTLVFDIEVSQLEELEKCKSGDYVNLWIPKDGSCDISIFRRGSIGGDGRIGHVPKKNLSLIYNHLNQGLEYETEILEIDLRKSRCAIKCRLVAKEETARTKVNEAALASNSLKSELQKKYTPQKSFSIRVQLPKNHKLKEGQKLYLQKQSLEHYVENALQLKLNFIDENGTIVAQKTNEAARIRSVLKAFFNGLPLSFQLSSIEKPDEYTLKYLERIEATVVVSFNAEVGT